MSLPISSTIAGCVVIWVGSWFWDWRLGLFLIVGAPAMALFIALARRLVDRGKAIAEPAERELATRVVELARCQGALRSCRAVGRYGRLRAAFDDGARAAVRLARALRRVRAGLALPLPDLVVLTEQALGLDIEVAARVGNPLGRRALDRFRQVAEQFAAQTDRPAPAGFLAWLDAAEERENGMEAPRVEPEPGAVQLLTIHAAKGLEWDAVAVAGLVEQVFPSYRARAREDLAVADRGWMTDAQELPHPLRADARTLPPFAPLARAAAGLEAAAIKDAWEEYTLALGRFALAEERRLAYVALTRARHDLLLTGSHLAGRATAPRPMSRFLAELVRRDLVDAYEPGLQDYDEDLPNPLVASGATGTWPPPEPEFYSLHFIRRISGSLLALNRRFQ